MKIIPFYKNEKQLIRRAKANDRGAQQLLYEKYAAKMLGVCRQYIKDVHFAEDVMVGGFVKVFKKMASFEGKGSFEGWIRSIMVRESISHLRKRQFVVYDSELSEHQFNAAQEQTSIWDVEHIQQLIDMLPEGYKTVFLLYAVEGYKHHEIAKMLNISEGTSKSQLFKARKILQDNIRLADRPSRSESNG